LGNRYEIPHHLKSHYMGLSNVEMPFPHTLLYLKETSAGVAFAEGTRDKG
jgi:hypothetical protein